MAILLVVATWHQWVAVVDFVVAQVGSMGRWVWPGGGGGLPPGGLQLFDQRILIQKSARTQHHGNLRGTATFTQPRKTKALVGVKGQ